MSYKKYEIILLIFTERFMSKAKTLDQAYEQILSELLVTFLKKHKDYGKGNILSVKELGISMRISEKVERLKHLLLKEEMGEAPANESIEDSWTDIAVYAILARLLRNGQFEKLSVDPKKMENL